jgi:hypothetical protein
MFDYGCVLKQFKKKCKWFFKGNFDLGVGWTHYHKTTPTNPKRVFGYGGLFVTLKGMQLFIN